MIDILTLVLLEGVILSICSVRSLRLRRWRSFAPHDKTLVMLSVLTAVGVVIAASEYLR